MSEATPLALPPAPRPRNWRLWIILSVVLILGIGWGLSRLSWWTYAGLRAKYPLESLAARLDAFTPVPRVPFSTATGKDLDEIEQQIDVVNKTPPLAFFNDGTGKRSGDLRRLHDHTYNQFVEQSRTFGIGRMQDYPGASPLRYSDIPELPDVPLVAQPGSMPYLPGSVDDVELSLVQQSLSPLRLLHSNSIVDFVYPLGFGYVKSRTEVAGFQPHRFSKVPQIVNWWSVQRLELIGLLLSPTPRVYDSDHLPRMTDVHKIPTRSLTRFESAALAELQRGADLLSAETPDGLRMVGAIRSAKQCIACHGGERGDLLGAFSYVLQPAP